MNRYVIEFRDSSYKIGEFEAMGRCKRFNEFLIENIKPEYRHMVRSYRVSRDRGVRAE